MSEKLERESPLAALGLAERALADERIRRTVGALDGYAAAEQIVAYLALDDEVYSMFRDTR